MTIEEMNLEPVAEEAARQLQAAFPHIRFTSGRRSIRDQARAMSQNVAQNRHWIYQTYSGSEAAIALQKYVDGHPGVKTAKQFEDAFVGILEAFDSRDLTALSKHLGGEAFDVRPVTQDAAAIKAMIRGLPGLTKFLDKEGGLQRWHMEFS